MSSDFRRPARSGSPAACRAASRIAAIAIASAAASVHAGLDVQNAGSATVGVPWSTGIQPLIDTVNIDPSSTTTDAPGNFTNVVGENFIVRSQTFTATSNFQLGKIAILADGSTTTGLSLHLYELQPGTGGTTGLPGSYTPGAAGTGSGPAPDLFSGLTFNMGGFSRSILEFQFSGVDQVNLQTGKLYAFEIWRSDSAAGAMNWYRTGGATGNPDVNPSATYPNPYLDGNAYNAAVTDVNTFRSRNTGNDRDMFMAVYDVSALPPIRVDLDGGGAGTLHPTQAGFSSWNALPTSGQNGNPAQNGYPTATATQTFASGRLASGLLTATLNSRDVGGAGAPVYLNGTSAETGPRMNARDMSITGREFDGSGNFTPTKDNVYRDYAVAEAGEDTVNSNNGTNHRMEIKFEGLDPSTPYKIKFYAYDNANPQGVSVFTDVTAQPLIFMPSAFASGGTFAPGDGTGGTQYAPSGQYIDGSAAPTFPTTDDFRAITLYATSDTTGKLVFAETTVTGVTGVSGIMPVLNGWEIEKDQRTWQGGSGDNWSTAGNWDSGNIPSAKGQVANFANSANTSITVDAPTTVARLNFGGSSMNISGPGTLTLDDTSINSTLSFNVTGRTEINLTAASANQTISAAVQMNKDTQVWVASAPTTLTVSNLLPAQVVLTKVGAGKLAVNNVRANTLRALEGTVQVLPNGGAAGVSVVNTLNVGASATVDLSNNDLVANNMTFTAVKSLVLAGATGGITSSTSTGSQTLALFDNALVNRTNWEGIPIGANAIVGKYTYFGDVNLDGQVTGDDYTVIDSNLNTTPNPGVAWMRGDANSDGNVTGDDYTVIDSRLGLGVGNPLIPASLTVVPEPGAVGFVLGLGALAGRRQRRLLRK